MTIINNSYEVLSDPVKKNEHDLWIKETEKEMNSNKQSNSENYSSSQTATQPLQFSCLVKLFFSLLNNIKNFLKETFYFAIRLGIAIAFI